jgi:hypothetical protein
MVKGGLYNLKSGVAGLGDLQGGYRSATMFAGTNGVDYFVDPANGNDANDGLDPENAFASIAAGYAATTANQHDIVWYIAGSSGTNLTAALTWSKNYTHLIGICAPTRIGQRARIFQLSTLTGASPLLTISASGCYFANFYIFQGVADATSLINVSVTGGRNYFENVHFAGGGHATQAVNGGASLKLDGGATGTCEENTFVGCTIGVDTVDAATGMMGILFDGEAHRNEFYECTVRMRAGNGGAGFVEIVDATGIDRDTKFVDCWFINNSATDMTSGFVIPAGMGAPRKLLLKDCVILGTAKLDASDRGVLFGNMNAVTGADTSGEMVELIT